MSKRQLTIEDIELCQTEDQSWTVLHKDLDAHYRSTHGAESESEWVFINGTRLLEQKQWNITELGFGIGTNLATVLKVRNTLNSPPRLHYIGIDHQPIPSSVLLKLMPESKHRNWLVALLKQIEDGSTVAVVEIEEQNIRLELQARDISDITITPNWTSAFFHDPFGPSTNPEAWSVAVFQRIHSWMTPDGVLATYGAAGHARRAMASAGFWTASTKGFGRKREMTIASPSDSCLSHGTVIRKYPPYMEYR